MKKGTLLHSQISRIVAEMGHGDSLVICDAGLPIPRHVERIDLALRAGLPGFLETLAVVLAELEVESAVIASELSEKNAEVFRGLSALLPPDITSSVTHERFKLLTANSRALIRTGECSPYANVILHSGVVF